MLSGILSGKHGNKESIVTWTRNCIIANFVMIGFFILIDPSSITSMGITMHQPCDPRRVLDDHVPRIRHRDPRLDLHAERPRHEGHAHCVGQLREAEVPEEMVRNKRSFHFGTLSMTLRLILVTTKTGAIRSMPEKAAVESILARQ